MDCIRKSQSVLVAIFKYSLFYNAIIQNWYKYIFNALHFIKFHTTYLDWKCLILKEKLCQDVVYVEVTNEFDEWGKRPFFFRGLTLTAVRSCCLHKRRLTCTVPVEFSQIFILKQLIGQNIKNVKKTLEYCGV